MGPSSFGCTPRRIRSWSANGDDNGQNIVWKTAYGATSVTEPLFEEIHTRRFCLQESEGVLNDLLFGANIPQTRVESTLDGPACKVCHFGGVSTAEYVLCKLPRVTHSVGSSECPEAFRLSKEQMTELSSGRITPETVLSRFDGTESGLLSNEQGWGSL